MGNGWSSYASALSESGTKRCRGTLRMAASTAGSRIPVSPSVSHGHEPFIEAMVCAGFLGLLYLVFEMALKRTGPVPLKDPRMRECLEYHQ